MRFFLSPFHLNALAFRTPGRKSLSSCEAVQVAIMVSTAMMIDMPMIRFTGKRRKKGEPIIKPAISGNL